MRFCWLCFLLALPWLSCGPRTVSLEEFQMRSVTLPNGTEIRTEVMINPIDMERGMMFRDSLPRGRGMLFIHPKPGAYTYWMYQVKIPLDIVWMDANRRIVEISANAPPCRTRASECPTYGGHEQSQFVLELGAGEAQRYRLRVGDTLGF